MDVSFTEIRKTGREAGSRGGGADDKFVLVCVEIHPGKEIQRQFRDGASPPLHLDRKKVISLHFSLHLW